MFILAPKNLSGIFDELKFSSEIFGCEDNDKQSAILMVGGFPNICVFAFAIFKIGNLKIVFISNNCL